MLFWDFPNPQNKLHLGARAFHAQRLCGLDLTSSPNGSVWELRPKQLSPETLWVGPWTGRPPGARQGTTSLPEPPRVGLPPASEGHWPQTLLQRAVVTDAAEAPRKDPTAGRQRAGLWPQQPGLLGGGFPLKRQPTSGPFLPP